MKVATALKRQPGGPVVTIETIDKETALKYLKTNCGNRNMSRLKTRAWAAEITRGRWHVTHQGIAFDWHGRLRDGQHRLQGIVDADISVQIMVARNLDPDSFRCVDTGSKRTPGDFLTMTGEKNAAKLAQAARAYYHYATNTESSYNAPGVGRATAEDLMKAVAENPGLRETVRVCSSPDFFRFCSTGILAAAFQIFKDVDEEQATKFIYSLRDGDGLPVDDPIYRLRELFINRGMQKVTVPAIYNLATIIKAWNLWREGKKVTRNWTGKLLSFSPSPRPVGGTPRKDGSPRMGFGEDYPKAK